MSLPGNSVDPLPSGARRLSVLLTAPNISQAATGEAHSAWRWAESLSHLVDLTVLTLNDNPEALVASLPKARVVTRPMPRMFRNFNRFQTMVKPHYLRYMRVVRQFLNAEADNFDLAHQILPQAARYPSPLSGFGIPYVIGPLGGTLDTPRSFRAENRSASWFTRFRVLDKWRFRYDPWLRQSYKGASLVLGVAPYMSDVLAAVPLTRFEPLLEFGVADIPDLPMRSQETHKIKLLHVGRGVRTKGLRDVVRAMALLKEDLPELRLTSAGTGEEIEICRAEAAKLGISDRIEFLGLIPRDRVEQLYFDADIFAFPSFREPAGNVVYEAMRWGLPIIAADRGGPGYLVDDSTGVRIAVTDPDQYAHDIANAIRRLANDPDLRRSMGQQAQAKLRQEGLWPSKARALVLLYNEVLASTGPSTPVS